MAAETIPESPPVCPECQMGTLRPRRVPFAHWFEVQFILVPDFPGWVCDVCGRCEYDSQALDQLELVLGLEDRPRRLTPQRPPRGTAPETAFRPPHRRHRV